MTADDIAALRGRCEDALRWAHPCLAEGQAARAVQESYFAAFYAAKAALMHLRIRSKKHNSVQGRISELVDQGRVRCDAHNTLETLFDRRNEAAYHYARGDWTEREAIEALEAAEAFVEEMRAILRGPAG